MPRIRRENLPPRLLDHLLDRVDERNISAAQLGLLSDWLRTDPEVPVGRELKMRELEEVKRHWPAVSTAVSVPHDAPFSGESVKLFLDASVLLAAADARGASRAIFMYSTVQHWDLDIAIAKVIRHEQTALAA
jgi:hypothetical protein